MNEQYLNQQLPPPPAAMESPTKPKKPWYKKWWAWVLIVLGLMVFGAALGDEEETAPQQTAEAPEVDVEPVADETEPEPEVEEESEPAEEPEPEPEPVYDGTKFAQEIYEKWLLSWGISADGSFETINEDPDEFYSIMGEIVRLESREEGNIVAILGINESEVDKDEAQKLAEGQTNLIMDDRVKTLEFESADGIIVGSTHPDRKPKPRSTTDAGLYPSTAQVVCDRRAELEFPYGVKMHWFLGKIAEEITADKIFFKIEATVTNMYGAELSGVIVECQISGTDDNPEIIDFTYY